MLASFGFGGYLPDLLPEEFAARDLLVANGADKSWDVDAQDAHWMRETLRASMEGCGKASPNPSVGCVLVCEGKEIARGCTDFFGGQHGERVAFSRVPPDTDWSKVTVYALLEPCAHHGKQPPCADLVVEKKPARVVVALVDPFASVNGRGFAKIRAAGIPLRTGVLAREAALWLSPFLLATKTKRPVLVGKWAQTLDGCLADESNAWRWITGPSARRYTHWLRRKYDGILVGAGTLLNDAPKLDVRDLPEPSLTPLRMVFDPHARLLSAVDLQKNALRQGTLSLGSPLVVFVSESSYSAERDGARAWHDECERHGVRFVPFPAKSSADLLAGFFAALESTDLSALRPGPFRARPLQSVLVEGGPTLLNALFGVGAIDICHAFLAPFFLGGVKNRIGCIGSLESAERHVSLANFRAGNDVVWEFMPPRIHALLESSWLAPASEG